MDTFKPATDWGKCCLCQENISEILKRPNFSRRHGQPGYRVLDINITELQNLNDLPLPLNPLRLNNGSGIEQTLVENGAKYHPSCYLLFSNTQVQRAKKRKKTGTGDTDPSQSWAKRSHIDTKQNVCFICEEFDERKNLHQVEFVKTCVKLKEMANSVNDIRLMAILSGPDAIALELKYHTKCYIDLSNRLRSAISTVHKHEEEVPNNRTSYAVALSELISYMFER